MERVGAQVQKQSTGRVWMKSKDVRAVFLQRQSTDAIHRICDSYSFRRKDPGNTRGNVHSSFIRSEMLNLTQQLSIGLDALYYSLLHASLIYLLMY